MGIGKIDPEYAVREGWARDSDDEIYMDGYNSFIQISTRDGTSGFQVKNDIGAVAFSSKSDGDGYVAKRLGVGTYFPQTELEVIGKTRTDQFQMPTGAVSGYVLTSDSNGNAAWEDAYVAGGGIDENEHRDLDQLVHLVAESSYDKITYESGFNKVSNLTVWTDSGMTTKIREEQYTYVPNSLNISQLVTIQYDGSGVEAERVTETFTYSGNKITSITRILS